MAKKRLTFDFETQSASDLKKEGAYKYSLDPTTRPTCLSFKVHGDDRIWILNFEEINWPWSMQSEAFRVFWYQKILEGYLFSAHNAFFERCIYENILVKRYGWPTIPFRQYRCTAAKAAACALPRNLEGAGEAMKLPIQKDKGGYGPMMMTCRPTKEWKKWNENGREGKEPPMFLTPKTAPDVFERLYYYCKRDVTSEECLDDTIPDLSSDEQEVWFLNQEINWRGLRIDILLVKKIVGILEEESKTKTKELDHLTMGLIRKPGQRKRILEFLNLEGISLPDLRAQTVDDKLSGFELSEDMRRLLEIRQALSKTSTRKYQSFLDRAGKDGRVRDIILYHGASTGRDTGTGIQPHNFPRGVIKVDPRRPYAAVENVVQCDADTLRLLYGRSLGFLFSSILRNMIIPSKGYELFVADFAKIEVAVLWWLADNHPGLKALREKKDPYIYQAAANLGRTYESFDELSPERNLGKAQVLGCGFGMGWEKFKQTAWDMHRLRLTDEQAQQAVANYRNTNSAVPLLWRQYEEAAIEAIEGVWDTPVKAGKCEFVYEKDSNFLWVLLPSGRKLAYREPEISWRETEYGSRKTLEFHAVNSKTKRWGLERTWGGTLTENIVQGTARDLLMPAMVRLEKAGYRALLTVHDEGISERKKGQGSVEEFVKILCETPPWGKGLPIDAKGWKGPRYRK